MEFEERISSSNKSYYINTITDETQWGSKNFFNTKIPLPKGYICLISNGEDVYKYIGNDNRKKSEVRYYSYAPKYFDTESQKLIKETYKHLEEVRTEQAKDEIYRRIELFKNVAKLLKRTPESIIDESLEFLAGKAEILPQIIIEYIQTTENEELGENSSVTAFSTISQMDPSFSSERSIRELCGLNMREEELSSALKQVENLICGISLELMNEPVMSGCINGHTFDKLSMTTFLKTGGVNCPTCKAPVKSDLIPNVLAIKILDDFTDKYVNQRGEIWNKIKEMCMNYKSEQIIRKKSKQEDTTQPENTIQTKVTIQTQVARLREGYRARELAVQEAIRESRRWWDHIQRSPVFTDFLEERRIDTEREEQEDRVASLREVAAQKAREAKEAQEARERRARETRETRDREVLQSRERILREALERAHISSAPPQLQSQVPRERTSNRQTQRASVRVPPSANARLRQARKQQEEAERKQQEEAERKG
jgi:hypothetical protein